MKLKTGFLKHTLMLPMHEISITDFYQMPLIDIVIEKNIT